MQHHATGYAIYSEYFWHPVSHPPGRKQNMEYIYERFCCRSSKIVAFTLLLLVKDDEREVKRGKTRLRIKRRQEKGYFANIVQELMIEDVEGFREMFRMKLADFNTILR